MFAAADRSGADHGADLIAELSFDRYLLTCHKDLWVLTQQCVEAHLNRDNPAKLFGIVGHGLSIALGVDALCDVCRSRHT